MADQSTQIQDLLGRRRDWTPVAVQFDHVRDQITSARLLKQAEAKRWRLINLSKFNGDLPPGLIVAGAMGNWLPTADVAVMLRKRQIPTVRLGIWPHPKDELMPAVVPDMEKAGRVAAEHFAERGFKQVGYVGSDPWGNNRHMYEAFAARAQELGCVPHLKQFSSASVRKKLKPGQEFWQARQEDFTEWLLDKPKPFGLLGFADTVADLYCQWALEAGLRVPEQVAVLGMKNSEYACESAALPLSSVAFDQNQIVERAVELLDELMAGKKPQRTTITVPPRGVVTRRSTDVLAATDPVVVEALRFMWDHVDDDLSVDQIAEQVGVSRSKLEKAFKRDVGRGINGEFQRRRLEKACELIKLTDLSIAEVASALSYSSPSYFSQVFRAGLDMTPAEYRRTHQSD